MQLSLQVIRQQLTQLSFPLPARSIRQQRRVYFTRTPLPEKSPDLQLQSTKWTNDLTLIEYREKKEIESFTELKELLGVSDEVISAIKEKAIL